MQSPLSSVQSSNKGIEFLAKTVSRQSWPCWEWDITTIWSYPSGISSSHSGYPTLAFMFSKTAIWKWYLRSAQHGWYFSSTLGFRVNVGVSIHLHTVESQLIAEAYHLVAILNQCNWLRCQKQIKKIGVMHTSRLMANRYLSKYMCTTPSRRIPFCTEGMPVSPSYKSSVICCCHNSNLHCRESIGFPWS